MFIIFNNNFFNRTTVHTSIRFKYVNLLTKPRRERSEREHNFRLAAGARHPCLLIFYAFLLYLMYNNNIDYNRSAISKQNITTNKNSSILATLILFSNRNRLIIYRDFRQEFCVIVVAPTYDQSRTAVGENTFVCFVFFFY